MSTLQRATSLVWVGLLLIGGACSKPAAVVDATVQAPPPAELSKVTFYVPGMNQKLQVL